MTLASNKRWLHLWSSEGLHDRAWWSPAGSVLVLTRSDCSCLRFVVDLVTMLPDFIEKLEEMLTSLRCSPTAEERLHQLVSRMKRSCTEASRRQAQRRIRSDHTDTFHTS